VRSKSGPAAKVIARVIRLSAATVVSSGTPGEPRSCASAAGRQKISDHDYAIDNSVSRPTTRTSPPTQ
jgi:hypothetical protein